MLCGNFFVERPKPVNEQRERFPIEKLSHILELELPTIVRCACSRHTGKGTGGVVDCMRLSRSTSSSRRSLKAAPWSIADNGGAAADKRTSNIRPHVQFH